MSNNDHNMDNINIKMCTFVAATLMHLRALKT